MTSTEMAAGGGAFVRPGSGWRSAGCCSEKGARHLTAEMLYEEATPRQGSPVFRLPPSTTRSTSSPMRVYCVRSASTAAKNLFRHQTCRPHHHFYLEGNHEAGRHSRSASDAAEDAQTCPKATRSAASTWSCAPAAKKRWTASYAGLEPAYPSIFIKCFFSKWMDLPGQARPNDGPSCVPDAPAAFFTLAAQSRDRTQTPAFVTAPGSARRTARALRCVRGTEETTPPSHRHRRPPQPLLLDPAVKAVAG